MRNKSLGGWPSWGAPAPQPDPPAFLVTFTERGFQGLEKLYVQKMGGGRGPGPGLRPGTLGLLKGNALSQNSYMIFGNAGDNGMDELCALRSHQNCGLIPNQLELGESGQPQTLALATVASNVVIRYRSELCGIKCRH